MKVSKLTGAQLDYWVAKAAGISPIDIRGDTCVHVVSFSPPVEADYQPSTAWAQGGLIIERERISICPIDFFDLRWSALVDGKDLLEACQGQHH